MAFISDFRDAALIFKAWIDKPMVMGAIAPSGLALTAVVSKQVDPNSRGPIIELGPGTGVMAEALVLRGIDPKRLILIEFNKAFCHLLSDRFKGATIINGDAYQIKKSLEPLNLSPTAAIISGLPLYSRPQEERIKLVRDAFHFMAPNTPFIQFSYAPASPIPVGLKDIEVAGLPLVSRNLPPARVWIYRKRQIA